MGLETELSTFLRWSHKWGVVIWAVLLTAPKAGGAVTRACNVVMMSSGSVFIFKVNVELGWKLVSRVSRLP